MTHDNFTTILVAFINAMPWIVGLWLARKRRLEKRARERYYKSHSNPQHSIKTDGTHRANEHGKGRPRISPRDGND